MPSEHFTIVDRNSRTYQIRRWTRTDHNFDFIVERDGIAYGVEVKNTFPYMPQDEFEIKLDMCSYLGISPLFIVRARSGPQWDTIQAKNGMMYMFKSKLFPIGQEKFTSRIWETTRLPVDIASDMPQRFYDVIDRHHKSLVHDRY